MLRYVRKNTLQPLIIKREIKMLRKKTFENAPVEKQCYNNGYLYVLLSWNFPETEMMKMKMMK